MCAFGQLSWEKTGVQGLRLATTGELFVTMPEIESRSATIRRRAVLQLEASGAAKGAGEMSWTGQEALDLRLDVLDKDDASRRKEIEARLKQLLPPDATLVINEVTGWDDPERAVAVTFALEIPRFGMMTGRRRLLSLSIFQSDAKHPFQRTNRIHPVYLPYPHQVTDEVVLSLPAGFQVESLPMPRTNISAVGRVETRYERHGGEPPGGDLRFTRQFAMEGTLIPVPMYATLRGFYDTVQSGDRENVVILANPADIR